MLSLPTRLTAIAALLVGATVMVVAGVAARLTRDDLGRSLDRRLAAAAASFRDGPAGHVDDPGRLAGEARRWLDKAMRQADQTNPYHWTGAPFSASWEERRYLPVLRREATALLEGLKPGDKVRFAIDVKRKVLVKVEKMN